MGINILYGQSQRQLFRTCYKEVSENKSLHERSIFIVPETQKFDVEHEYLRFSSLVGIMKTEVLSFSRFCRKIIEDVGMNNREYIDRTGQTMLVYRILKENPDEFLLYKNLSRKPGFVISLVSVIGEMKRFLLDGKALMDASSKIPDKVLSQKTFEMGFLISRYDQYLEELKLSDPQEDYPLAAKILQDLAGMRNEGNVSWPYERLKWVFSSSFKVTGFAGKRNFTLQESKIINLLAGLCDITVTAVCDKDSFNADSIDLTGDIFRAGAKAAMQLKGKNPQKTVLKYIQPEYSEIFEHMDNCLRSLSQKPYLGNTDKVNVFTAMSKREEIKMIAGEIKKLVDGQSFRYRDIAIVASDSESYLPLVKSVFKQAGIPVYTGDKKTLHSTCLGELSDCLFNVLISNWSQDSIISFLRCGICGFDRKMTDEFENYLLEKGIKGKSWIFNEKFYLNDGKTYLYEFVSNSFSEVFTFEEKIIAAKNERKGNLSKACDLSDAFLVFLEKGKFYEKIEVETDKLLKKGEDDIATGLAKAWNMLLNLIYSVKKIAGETDLDMKGFKDIIRRAMEGSFSGTIPSSIDKVQFSDISQLPASEIKILFVSGLSEDLYPESMPGEGLFRDNEREILSDIFDMEIPSLMSDKIYEDKFITYSFLTLPSEKIYLTSPECAPKESFVIDFVRKCFPGHNHVQFNKNPKPLDVQIHSIEECIFEMVRQLKFGHEEKDTEWVFTNKILSCDTDIKNKTEYLINMEKKSQSKNRIPEKLVASRYTDPVMMSISQIEKYMACAYSHLMTYMVKITPRKTRQINSADTGNILHAIAKECIEDFICEYKEKSMPQEREKLIEKYKNIDFYEYCLEKLNQIAGKEGAEVIFDNGVFASSGLKISSLSASFLKAVFNSIGEGEFIPDITEWEFSPGQNTSIKIKEEHLPEIHVRGKIDRVDIKSDYYRVIDYKSSDKSVNFDDIFSGISIQLPAYIMAYKNAYPDKLPADAAYMQFSRPILDYENIGRENIEEKHEDKLSGEYKIKGMKMEPQDLILTGEYGKTIIKKGAKGILGGNFPVNPKILAGGRLPCDFCDYNGICGFEIRHDNPQLLEKLPEIINEEGKKEKKQTVFIETVKEKIRQEGDGK